MKGYTMKQQEFKQIMDKLDIIERKIDSLNSNSTLLSNDICKLNVLVKLLNNKSYLQKSYDWVISKFRK